MNSPAQTLRLTWWHLGLWLGLAVVAGGLSLQACLRYNDVAGTDKTPAHIAVIAAAVLAGPLVGPVANPDASPFKLPPKVIAATLGLLVVQGLALLPFLVVKRAVSTPAFVVAWAGFILAAGIWFGAALVSLGIFLS